MSSIKNIVSANTSNVVMFGLGAQFRDCYRELVLSFGQEPDFLCDNDEKKWGKEYFGKRCISPADLCNLGKDIIIVITVRRYEQIYKQMQEKGFYNIFLACFDRAYDVVFNIKPLSSDNQVRQIQKLPENLLQGKWTLITGASRGIGRQIALQMAKLGSNIIAHSRSLEHTRELVIDCKKLGVQVRPVAAELSKSNELDNMLEYLENDCSPIDIIYNNAGISKWGEIPWKTSASDYLMHYAVNTVAPIEICNRLIPGMINRGYGRIINISSTLQKQPHKVAYAMSKAALNKFVFDMAPGLKETGVMMSLLCPGHVNSEMGGINAPHNVESVIPGALLGAVMDDEINGRWFIAQDYSGLTLDEAIIKAKYYYSWER